MIDPEGRKGWAEFEAYLLANLTPDELEEYDRLTREAIETFVAKSKQEDDDGNTDRG